MWTVSLIAERANMYNNGFDKLLFLVGNNIQQNNIFYKTTFIRIKTTVMPAIDGRL